jgi:hypothetical protein
MINSDLRWNNRFLGEFCTYTYAPLLYVVLYYVRTGICTLVYHVDFRGQYGIHEPLIYLTPIPLRNPSSSCVALYGMAVAAAAPAAIPALLPLALALPARLRRPSDTANPAMSTGKARRGRDWPRKPETRPWWSSRGELGKKFCVSLHCGKFESLVYLIPAGRKSPTGNMETFTVFLSSANNLPYRATHLAIILLMMICLGKHLTS